MSLNTKNAAATAVSYNQLRVDGDKATFIGPVHTDIIKDQLTVQSIAPKRAVDSYGNRRSTVNYLSGITVATPDGKTAAKDLKVELNVSTPVGATDAQVGEALTRILSLTVADLKSIVVTGKIQF